MKNFKLLIATSLIFFCNTILIAQEYFQQEVNYKIKVSLDDKKHMLHAFEEIEYTNNSPEALDFLYFHTWPNAYSKNTTALAQQKMSYKGKYHLFNNEGQKGYIDSMDFRVNGKKANFKIDKKNPDIGKLELLKPLKPGENIIITTPFKVKIPKAITSRFGYLKQAYKITQWYPKPAVYDKKGWHQFPYYDMGEFYYEYGSFDVTISLPKNYVVAATGNLQTKSEIEWLHQKVKETKAIKEFDKDDLSIPPSSDQTKNIRYTEQNIHDFAWFADKRYHVLKSQVKLPNSGRKVDTWAFFRNNEADKWVKATGYINDALYYYSKWYGDYPYDNCTAILNAKGARGNGMEYPTITAIGSSFSDMMLEMVIMHEVGHNWFYGVLGFNEREHPWLDEGLNSFSDTRYIQTKYDSSKNTLTNFLGKEFLGKLGGLDYFQYKDLNKISYFFNARINRDQPADMHTDEFTGSNYGNIVYKKSAMAFYYLVQYLGEEKFNQIMQKFYEDWKFKHPQPEDLEKAFQEGTDEDISWFFNDVIGSTKKVDYKTCKVKDDKLLVKNKGDMATPFPITGMKGNKEVFTRWYDGIKNKQWIELPENKVDKYVIDQENVTLDLYSYNNTIKAKGLLKKVEPLKVRFIGPVNIPGYTQINFIPVVGWNNYNKTMTGIYFHNGFLPSSKFTYDLMPFYGFGNQGLAGNGNVTCRFYPNSSTVQNFKVKLHGLQYAYGMNNEKNFNKIAQTTTIEFKKPYPKSKKTNRLILKTIYATDIGEIMHQEENPSNRLFNSLAYTHNNHRSINPYYLKTKVEASDDYVKSSFTGQYKLSYYKRKGLRLKLFAGAFLNKVKDFTSQYYYHLSGSAGTEDYLYENIFLGRFENPLDANRDKFLSQQFVEDQGGFISYAPVGVTNDWLASLNITSDLPNMIKFPLRLYGNIGAFGSSLDYPGANNKENFAYETGACLYLGSFLNIYFPAYVSSNMNDFIEDHTKNYFERIRFSIHLDQLSLRKIL